MRFFMALPPSSSSPQKSAARFPGGPRRPRKVRSVLFPPDGENTLRSLARPLAARPTSLGSCCGKDGVTDSSAPPQNDLLERWCRGRAESSRPTPPSSCHPERSEGSVSSVLLCDVWRRGLRILRLRLRMTYLKGGAVARRVVAPHANEHPDGGINHISSLPSSVMACGHATFPPGEGLRADAIRPYPRYPEFPRHPGFPCHPERSEGSVSSVLQAASGDGDYGCFGFTSE